MIKRCDHLDHIALSCVDQGDDARVHAAQVVQPPGGEKFLMRAKDRRRCGVVRPEVITIKIASGAASGLCYVIKNLYPLVTDTPHRHGVGLLVQLETLIVHTSIKMYCQLRNAHDRFGAYQQRAPVTQHKATRQTKFAIKPGVEQRSAVDLDTDLMPAIRTDVRPRLERETSRIRMRAKDPERH